MPLADKLFALAVRRGRWLAKLPGAPQVFDAMLLTGIALTRRARLHAIAKLEEEMRGWPGVELRVHRFGGLEFEREGRELGHVHGHGLLDVHLSRAAAEAALAEEKVRPHHVLPGSGWVSLQLESVADVPCALKLLEAAAQRRSSRS